MTEHLGHNKYEYSKDNKDNYRNGSSKKKVKSNLGELELDIPRNKNGEFEPVIIPKHSRDISNIEHQIINLYTLGTSTREISNYIEEIYAFVYIDAIHFNLKENGVVGKKVAYVVMGINKTGIKEVLGIYVGENETSKFWITVFNNIKNRGVKDILILSSDGLTGIKEAIQVSFPETEH